MLLIKSKKITDYFIFFIRHNSNTEVGFVLAVGTELPPFPLSEGAGSCSSI